MPNRVNGTSSRGSEVPESSPRMDAALGSLGERTILENIVIPRLSRSAWGVAGIGDDCAEIPAPPRDRMMLVTTDPCPNPLVFELADRDYWHYGNMTILINVSDLAAMGADPSGIVISTVMPNDMPVREYVRYLDGLVEAADEWSCPIVGGNIKDGSEFTSTGTAFGTVEPGNIMRRTGAAPGDVVCVIGEMGLFWAAVLQQLTPGGIAVSAESSAALWRALYRPIPRLTEGRLLAQSRVVTACMDASDGVGACLTELGERNGLDIVIDGDSLVPHVAVTEVAAQLGVDSRKLMLAWGNWELVFTARPESAKLLQVLAAEQGFPFSVIGTTCAGSGKVWTAVGGAPRQVANFASERFTRTSYFTHGLKSYMRWLIDTPLVVGDNDK
jgi:thiamine-monophosphate kinase